MSEPLVFIDLAVRGDVLPDEIDDFVEVWHHSDSNLELHESLGLSWEEYSLWVADPEHINLIITARRKHQSIMEAVNDNLRYWERIAARADDAGKLAALRRWIESQPDR